MASYFAAQGVTAILGAIKFRGNVGWIWGLISGLASLVLGLMVFTCRPDGTNAIMGLRFGIHILFSGISLLAPGLAFRKLVGR